MQRNFFCYLPHFRNECTYFLANIYSSFLTAHFFIFIRSTNNLKSTQKITVLINRSITGNKKLGIDRNNIFNLDC